MCGLSGVAGSITGLEEDVAADLLYYNTLRGPDATGVATVERHKNHAWTIAKATVPAYTFFDMKRYETAMKGSHQVILQHNRRATVGGKGETFAHPWDFGHIVGAHNGTVNMSDIKKLPGQKDAVSDSYAILQTIDKLGPVKAMAELEDWMTNAWALTWYDVDDNSLNFLRNKERPLHFCFNSLRDTIFWSSEAFDLAAAILKNKVKRPEGEKCFMVMPDQHYKFVIPNWGQKFSAPEMTPVKYKKYVYQGGSGTGPFQSARTQTTQTTGSGTTGCNGTGTGGREQSPFCPSVGTGYDSRGAVKVTILKGDAAVRDENSRKSSLGKDKFPLMYHDDNVRIYLDSNTGKFHRYWWSEHTEQWNAYAHTGIPPEIAKIDIEQAVKDKVVHKNTPIIGKGVPTAPPKIPDTEQVRFNGQYVTVTKIKDVKSEDRWVLYKWDNGLKQWSSTRSESAPPEMPDHQLDVNSNHAFTHSGKRKNRKIFFKGFEGRRLDQKEFNTLTSCGCINCKRRSLWTDGRRGGVMVHFVSPDLFLCDFCAEDKTLLKEMIRIARDEPEKAKGPTIN